MKMLLALLASTALSAGSVTAAAQPPAPAPVRLYALDCGHLSIDDMGMFSDTGEHAGEHGELAVPCFLIRDGDHWLLWDTGLGDDIAATPGGMHKLGGLWTVRRPLAAQLAELGLKPADIDFVGLSHLHSDHTGNVALFPKATFLLGAPELAWAKSGGLGADPAVVSFLSRAKVKPVPQDEDVFGDGRVRVLSMPGHTPGHRSLLVKLAKAGTVLLSGDLYHTRENLMKGIVPAFNVDRADTLASFDRFRRIAGNTDARIVIQHVPEDVAALPAFPNYLD